MLQTKDKNKKIKKIRVHDFSYTLCHISLIAFVIQLLIWYPLLAVAMPTDSTKYSQYQKDDWQNKRHTCGPEYDSEDLRIRSNAVHSRRIYQRVESAMTGFSHESTYVRIVFILFKDKTSGKLLFTNSNNCTILMLEAVIRSELFVGGGALSTAAFLYLRTLTPLSNLLR